MRRMPRGNRRQAHQTDNSYVESETQNAAVSDVHVSQKQTIYTHGGLRLSRQENLSSRSVRSATSSHKRSHSAEALTSGVNSPHTNILMLLAFRLQKADQCC
ncbi:hypothetical protein BC936DRAFT_148482 [Jimgerdemannia flammicorona]|uniref:Uncharacterized protein n=1 Tax=Jimgerdemannia flammicorona TaxID=994334 RepID=A0A433D2Z8_9FUNG|nr:hypothetical protein BC936DRAFT_148482 [Jimgerdemannia flammicorona]